MRSTLLWLGLLLWLFAARAEAQTVRFSPERGFFTEPITLTLDAPPGYTVHYTLDGSEPTPNDSAYTAPLRIADRTPGPNRLSTISRTTYEYATWAPPVGQVAKGTPVRAALFQNGERVGPIFTHTYWIFPEGRERYTLPVMSLVSDSLHFFSDETGIYVLGNLYRDFRAQNPNYNYAMQGGAEANYTQRGEAWERPVHIEYILPDATVPIAHDAGVRIHGGWSRAFRQKALRLYSRSDYGTSRFRYRFFEDLPLSNFNRLLLRHSGQDWTQTMLRDAFHQTISVALDFEKMAYQPVLVFLNGEFWGLHNLRERMDEDYLETRFGVHADSVDILENNRQVQNGSNLHYRQMLAYAAANDLARDEHLAHLTTLVDVDSYRDYVIANVFINNRDWPQNNIQFWRKQTTAYRPDAPFGHDGRWRWMMFDTDFGFGWNIPTQAHNYNTLQWALSPTGNGWAWSNELLRALMRNTSFRRSFAGRFQDMLNTTFTSRYLLETLERMQQTIRPHMQEHFDRWGYHDDRWKTPRNLADWDARLNLMRYIAQERPAHVWEHVRTEFGLGVQRGLSVRVADPAHGHVQVNSLHLRPETPGLYADTFNPWNGVYLTGQTMRLEAHPANGFRFVRWETNVTGLDVSQPVLHFPHNRVASFTAVFEEDPDTWVEQNPLLPAPHRLANGVFRFDAWSSREPAGTFPPHMVFVQSDKNDPELRDALAFPYDVPAGDYQSDDLVNLGFPYALTRRTRLSGLGDRGLSMINTGRGRDLGGAILALDTRETGGIVVSWTAETLVPNSRTYHWRLEYRIGKEGAWNDVLDAQGAPVEYVRTPEAGGEQRIGPTELPAEVDDQPYVQLRWKYYFTGTRLSEDSGARDELRLDDILVTAATGLSSPEALPVPDLALSVFPHPARDNVSVQFTQTLPGVVTLTAYDVLGREVLREVRADSGAGTHLITLPLHLPPGLFLLVVDTPDGRATSRMVVQ